MDIVCEVEEFRARIQYLGVSGCLKWGNGSFADVAGWLVWAWRGGGREKWVVVWV